jgi:hypothetical protein
MLSLPLIPDRFSRCRAQYSVDRIRCTRWLLACLQPLSSPRRLSVHDFTFEAGSAPPAICAVGAHPETSSRFTWILSIK